MATKKTTGKKARPKARARKSPAPLSSEDIADMLVQAIRPKAKTKKKKR